MRYPRKLYKKLALMAVMVLGVHCSAAAAVFAQEQDPADRMYSFTLVTVSELALFNNLDIQLVKYDAYVKRNDIYDAVSIFDTMLNVGFSYEDDQLERASTLAGTNAKTTEYDFSLSKKFNTGTTLTLGADHSRAWSNSQFTAVNPAHDSQASVTFKQEVGKNFFGLIDRNEIKITKLDIENSDYSSIEKIESFLAQAQKAYWHVALMRKKTEIREKMLDRAISLHKIYTQKLKIGLAEAPDLYGAQANAAIRKNQLLESEHALRLAENNLLLQLNLPLRKTAEVYAKDDFSFEGARQADFIASLTIAIEHRRDYKQALNEIEAKKLGLVIKKNSLWPEIDLEASFVRNGVAQRYSDAIERISDLDNPKYYYGINISYPLENNKAKGEYQAAQLYKARSLLVLKKTERQIVVDIKDAVDALNTTYEQVKNNMKIVELQESKLKEEEERFRLGRSNSDTIIRFHDDLLEAKIALADSLYQYKSDVIDLRLKENSLLDEYWESVL